MTTDGYDDVRSLWEIREREAIRFEPVFPPRHGPDVTSYFGGLPRLPPHMAWPKMRSPAADAAKALSSTFVGQIDLSELPAIAPNPLPQTGTLFFFVDTAVEDLIFPGTPGTGGTIVYWEQSTSSVPFREEPADLPSCLGASDASWLHKQALGKGAAPPKSFTFCGVRPTPLKVHDLTYLGPPFRRIQPDDPDAVRRETETSNALWTRAHHHSVGVRQEWVERLQTAIERAASPPVPRNYFIFSVSTIGAELRAQSLAWRVREGFPYTWLDLEIFFGTLMDEIDKYREQRTPLARQKFEFDYYLRYGQRKSIKETARHVMRLCRATARHIAGTSSRLAGSSDLRRLFREGDDWLERVRMAGRWTPISAATRSEFYDWVDKNVWSVQAPSQDPRCWVTAHRALLESYRIGPRMCLAHSAYAAALIPDSWCESQRWQWGTNLSDYHSSGYKTINHHLLGQRNPIDPAQGDGSISLMEFATQDCFSWMWGDVGSIAFLITKEDLAAGNFSQAYVTLISG